MISKIAPPQIRATTGLELAAGLFTKCSDELASQLTVSLTSGKRESAQRRCASALTTMSMAG